MKILHLTNTNINYDSRILKEIAGLSEEYGSDKVFGFGVFLEEDAARDQVLDDPRFKIIYLISSKFRVLPRGARYVFALIEFTFRSILYGLKLKPYIVHCHDTFALPAGAFLSLFGVKVVYDAHELESDKKGQTVLLSKVTYRLERLCWPRISAFIAVSDSILGWYKFRFKDVPSKVILNSPVIRKSIASNAEATLHRKFEIPDDKLVFIYVGILSEGRGIDEILKSFISLKGSHVVFLGYGPLQELINSYAKKHGNIHYHPAVSHDRVTQVVESADYGFCLIENCSLSDYLCLPNKLFEYAFSGVKVIASDFPEIKKVVERHNLGVIVGERDSLDNVIRSIDANSSLEEANNLNSLSWESQERKLISLYSEILPVSN